MASIFWSFPVARAISLFALAALVSGCSVTPGHNLPAIPELRNQPEYDIADVDTLKVSPEMKQFIKIHAYENDGKRANAWGLVYAAMHPHVLRFSYDPQVTLPADKAFSKTRGNCLTFSGMMIAMAREAGMDAWFQEVEIVPEWSNVNDTILVSKHVNAIVFQYGQKYTIDVSRRKSKTNERTRRLSDREAHAQFYNNLGADALIEGNMALAYGYFRKGLELDRRLDYIWSNIGVILRRNGQTDDAIVTYRAALKINPDSPVALNNLYAIYDEEGNFEAAERLRARVERNQRKNPFYIQHLAETAIEERRYAEAAALAKKAVRMDDGEYRFYYTLARSQYFSGKTRQAQASLEQARELAPTAAERRSLSLPGG